MEIRPVKLDKRDGVVDVADHEAESFLIVDSYGEEVMRASTRALAQQWIDAPPSQRW